MQSLDEILLDIESKTEQLLRKLKELGMENELLQKENRQLKQDISANSKADLFSSSAAEKETSSKTQYDLTEIRDELELCIAEVKTCMQLVDKD